MFSLKCIPLICAVFIFTASNSAFCYEVVEANTVIPKKNAENGGEVQLRSSIEREEFRIPNPIDRKSVV